mgnify:CR=1 FL=1
MSYNLPNDDELSANPGAMIEDDYDDDSFL